MYTIYGKVNFKEQRYSERGTDKRIRPFSLQSGISTRGYTKRLRRAISDFGSDHSFEEASRKMKEHYRIKIPVSAARIITENHARQIEIYQRKMRIRGSAKKQVIAQTDGCMVPTVTTGLDLSRSERKKLGIKKGSKVRKIEYKEVRVSLAHEFKSKTLCYSAIIGSTNESGKQLVRCVERVGCDKKTKIHAVGDGAKWIANQIEDKFGRNGTYLIDFYHLCEYLAAAATVCAPDTTKAWLSEQKKLMKASLATQVLINLHGHIEPSVIPDAEAKVRVCYRYIENRLHQLDYKDALDKGLNIGSGEVESAHRHLVQKRLKIAGAAWKISTVNSMLALRTCRANNDWDAYWQQAA